MKLHCVDTVTVYNDDCLNVLNSPITCPTQFDVVVTSPPYNLGIKYNSYNDAQPRDQYLAWIEDVGRAVKRVLKPKGSFFLNMGSKPTDPWVAMDVAQRMRNHFTLQNVFHWVKSIAIDDNCAPGHFKPINSKRFVNDNHEYVYHFTINGDVELDKLAVGVPYQDKTNISRWNGSGLRDRRDRGNTWFIPYPTITSKRDRPHPASFPVGLAERCIRLHGVSETTNVLDPFFGIGTTGKACLNLRVHCTGIELDDSYFGESIEQLIEHRGGLAVPK